MKKHLRWLVLWAATTTSICTTAVAQPVQKQGSRGGDTQKSVKQLLATLDLTADQQKQVTAIQKNQRLQLESLRKTVDRLQMQPAVERIEADTDLRYQEVLTAKQYATYQTNKQALLQARQQPSR